MLFVFLSLLIFGLTSILFFEKSVFGKLPGPDRQQQIEKSPQFKAGSFQNRIDTPLMIKGASYPKMIWDFFFAKNNRYPQHSLPGLKTNLRSLSNQEITLVWLGHSSYLINVHGTILLIDPVFSKRASPVQYAGSKQFESNVQYNVSDLPDNIDALILTHDHYDHLDHATIVSLRQRVKHFYTPLGVGEHLEHWDVDVNLITEMDWWQQTYLNGNLQLTCTPARHFSGRSFKRNQSLWASYVLTTGTSKLFLGGDSGYDHTFKEVGEQFGPFDLALLEAGQYDVKWPHIHMAPEETVQAALDLKANVLMPVHWGKFALAMHPWNEPIERVVKAAASTNQKLTTPRVGEPIIINKHYPNQKWWKG